jgi:hypothetical protein
LKTFRSVSLVLIALAVTPASATILSNNYPINGTILGLNINSPYQISDSFTLGSGATLTGVNFGAWNFQGDTITSVDWAIGSVAFGSDHSGTAAVTATIQASLSPNTGGFNIYSDNFALPGISLAAGTYYLTLSNAIANGHQAFWDENDGAGIDAWQNRPGVGQVSLTGNCGFLHPNAGTCAESFQMLGDASVPEPGTIALLAGGLLLMAGVIARKRVIVPRF